MEITDLPEYPKISFIFKEEKYFFKVGEKIVDEKNLGDISIIISEISLPQISDIIKKYRKSGDSLTHENFVHFLDYFFKELLKIYSYSVAFFIKNIAWFYFLGYNANQKEFVGAMKNIAVNELGFDDNVDIAQLCINIRIFLLSTLLPDITHLKKHIEIFVKGYDTRPDLFVKLLNSSFGNTQMSYSIQAETYNSFIEIYTTGNPILFLMFEFCNMIKSEITMKPCANCGKYFIPQKRSDTIYCDRPSPQDDSMTCKEYGSKKLWYDKAKENKSTKLYRNIYMAKQMLSRNNPDIKEYKDDFEKYKIDVKQWRKDVKDGVKSDAEFITWLKSVRGKRYLD